MDRPQYTVKNSDGRWAVMLTISNARRQANENIDQFYTLLVALLQDRSLFISPDILAGFLVDLVDKNSLVYWEDTEPFQLVNMLKGVSAHLDGLKEAISQVFGETVVFGDAAGIKKLAKFYVAALKEGVMEPVKSIWAREDSWSDSLYHFSLGNFLGEVLQRMESLMSDSALSTFMLDTGIVDMVMSGTDFDSKLESQLKQGGGRARSILKKVCREKLIHMMTGMLFKENPGFSEDRVLVCARNLKIDEPLFTAMVWEAIITNLQSSGLQLKKRFWGYAQVLGDMERIKVVVRNNSVAFLASIKFPSRMQRLKKSVAVFLEDCVKCNVLDANAVSRWNTEMLNGGTWTEERRRF